MVPDNPDNFSHKQQKIKLFLGQLKLLLWKNAVLKKRRPVVTILETIIPLIIFIVLVLMRLRLPPVKEPIQMPKPQPLVSAGLVPMIQSVCINEKVCKPYGVPNGTYFHKLLNGMSALHNELIAPDRAEIEKSMGHIMVLSRKELQQVGVDYKTMRRELKNMGLVMNETAKFSHIFLTNATFRQEAQKMIEKYKADAFFRKSFEKQIDSNTLVFNGDKLAVLMELSGKIPELLDWLEFLPSDSCNALVNPGYDMRKLTRAALEMWHRIQPDLCANYQKLTMQDINLKRFEKLNLKTYQFLMLQHWQTFLEKNLKILYTPVTNETRRIVETMSSTIGTIQKLPTFLDNYLQVSQAFREYLKNNKPETYASGIVTVMDVITFLNLEFNNTVPEISTANETYPNFLQMLDVFDRGSCAIKLLLRDRDLNVFEGVATESHALDLMVGGDAARKGNRILAVIAFNVEADGSIGRHVSYKIRQLQSETADTRFIRSPYWYPGADSHGLNEYNYYTYGFLWIQDLVDRAIINYQTGRRIKSPGIYVQKFPTPCYDNDMFAQVIEHGMPLFMLLSWIYFSSVLVNAIIKEKETRLKESLKMMGLTRWVHWTAWFLTAFLHMQVTLVLLVLLIKLGNLLPNSNPLVVYAFFSLFCVTIISFCFFMSCLFNNSQVASAFTGILLLFLHVPFVFIHILETYNKIVISGLIKSGVCLVPVIPMAMGVKYFTVYEIQQEGIQWHNLGSSPIDGDNFSTLNAMFMMVVDSLIYALLAWYIEAVRPGPYGIPLPWYFPLMKSYWSYNQEPTEVSMQCTLGLCVDGSETGSYEDSFLDNLTSDPYSNPIDPNLFEVEPCDLLLGVAIKNLSKKYKNSGNKFALRNLSLNMYEGQITALLGHNGAGKSTTMSILCGVQPPSHGTAKIYSKDIRFQIESIRQEMGMCPQHNVLFDNLTVEEHLYLFANLKLLGSPSNVIKAEIDKLLQDMDLPADRNTLIRKLSSGVQRKLSVAMTFIGDPKLIILDEPTSNVDPQARRAIWDLLLKYKSKHTILMSTHFMDEAQMLGDRIAMISGGVLRCVGTPIYLLNRLGAGYHLNLYKKTQSPSSGSSGLAGISFATGARQANHIELTGFVRKYIASASLQRQTNTEIEFIIPRESVERESFEKLLTDLSSNLNKFGLSSFGVRDTSLEEVFFKICEGAGNLRGGNRFSELAVDYNESSSSHAEDYEHKPEAAVVAPGDHKLEGLYRDSHHSGPSNSVHAVPGISDSNELAVDNSVNNNQILQPTVVVNQPSVQSENQESQPYKTVSGVPFLMNQFWALSTKKLILLTQNPKVLLTQIAFPLLFMLAAMTMAFLSSYSGDTASLRMSTAQYQPYHIPSEMKNLVPVAAVISKTKSTLQDADSEAGPLDLVATLQSDSGIGADCTLAPGKNSNPFGILLPPPNFLHSDWCLPRGDWLFTTQAQQGEIFSRMEFANSSFVPSYKKFLDNYPTYKQHCENKKHRCEECEDGRLVCHNSTNSSVQLAVGTEMLNGEQYRSTTTVSMGESSIYHDRGSVLKEGQHEFKWDTWGNDRIVDVSEESSRYGFDVDDQFQLHAFNHRQRNRYGGLVFKDYVYEPGMVADLADIYSSLFAKEQAKVYYNSKGYHSIPVYVNAVNNAILRANLAKFNGSLDPQEFGITTFSQPVRAGSLPSKNLMDHGNDVIVAMLVLTGFCSLPASFLMHLVNERVSKMKHLQLVSGMNPVVYWTANLVWDFLTGCIPILLSYGLMMLIGVRAYSEGQNGTALLYLMVTYLWAVIPIMYLCSFVLDEPANAYVGLSIVNLLVGTITLLIVYMFDTVVRNDPVIFKLNSILKSCFVMFPIYNMGHGFTYIAFNQILNDFYQSFGLDEKVVEPFDWDVTTRGIVFNIIQGTLGFFLVILCEYNLFLHISVKTEQPLEGLSGGSISAESISSPGVGVGCSDTASGSLSHLGGGIDPDVKAEKERVKRSRDPIRLLDLTKMYTSLDLGRFRAVNNISVGIQHGEIFGLCGSNGAGKTELFKLLTLDTQPTEGSIFIDNRNSAKNKQEIWKSIGYCPQHDGLFGEMTGRQHLELFAALHGFSRQSIPKVVKNLISDLDLIECKEKQVDMYSGGMKRKLSAALTLIGDPKIVVLDDPTAGMDPRSRRFLWTLIKKLNETDGRTVIFASNSMDECERLCSRLAIMVRGSFISIGSVSYLKARHGDMYSIKCRLSPTAVSNDVTSFIKEKLPSAQVVEEHFNVINYEIAAEHLCLPQVFSLLGQNKTQLGIVDYSVSQKTLEMGYMNILRRELLLEQQQQQIWRTRSPKRFHNSTLGGAGAPSSGSTRAKFVRALKIEQQTGQRLATHAESST